MVSVFHMIIVFNIYHGICGRKFRNLHCKRFANLVSRQHDIYRDGGGGGAI